MPGPRKHSSIIAGEPMVSNMSIFFMGVPLGLSILFPVFLASW